MNIEVMYGTELMFYGIIQCI